jgi:hypothetical protein
MTDPLKALVHKGKRYPEGAVTEQADISITLANEYLERLLQFGYTRTKLDELHALQSELSAMTGRRVLAINAARNGTRDQEKAVDEAKHFIWQLRMVGPLVFSEHAIEGLTPDVLNPPGRLDRSVAKLMGCLERLRPLVEQIDGLLAPYFQGRSPSQQLSEIAERLGKLGGAQEVRGMDLPVQTERLQATKGRVITAIEQLNRVAQLAFADRPIVAAKFNKILRARSAMPAADGQESLGESVAEHPADLHRAEVLEAGPAGDSGDLRPVPGERRGKSPEVGRAVWAGKAELDDRVEDLDLYPLCAEDRVEDVEVSRSPSTAESGKTERRRVHQECSQGELQSVGVLQFVPYPYDYSSVVPQLTLLVAVRAQS